MLIGVYMRIFHDNGTAYSEVAQVNTIITGDQQMPEISVGDHGNLPYYQIYVSERCATLGISALRYTTLRQI